MTQFIMTNPVFREFDDDGLPLAGGSAYFYEAGTETPKDVFTDSAGATAHASPVVLDARGEAVIYGSGAYKVVTKDASGTTIRTVDNYKIFPISAFAETILDDADAAAVRTTLGLGTAAVLDAGTNPNNVVQLDAQSRLPAVDGQFLDLTKVPEIKFPPGVFAYPRAYLSGFAISNNTTSPNTHIDVWPGSCIDSTNTQNINMATSKSRNLAVLWGQGDTGDGGLDDTSTPQPGLDTWYYVFVICNPTTGASDILFSKSIDNPTLTSEALSGYTKFRRIGAIRTDGDGYIRGFIQHGDYFCFKTLEEETSGGNHYITLSTDAILHRLNVPYMRVMAKIIVACHGISNIYISCPDQADQAPSVAEYNLETNMIAPLHNVTGYVERSADHHTDGDMIEVLTDDTGQIRIRSSIANVLLHICTVGWIDRRGRDD